MPEKYGKRKTAPSHPGTRDPLKVLGRAFAKKIFFSFGITHPHWH
jgi:hypothetical protein